MVGTGGQSRVANPRSVMETTYANRFIIHDDGLCWGSRFIVFHKSQCTISVNTQIVFKSSARIRYGLKAVLLYFPGLIAESGTVFSGRGKSQIYEVGQ